MKIVSKFKDYYDYLQGKYGIDELRIYIRQTATTRSDDQINRVWEKSGVYVPPFLNDSYYYGNEFKAAVYHCDIIAVAGVIYVAYFYRGKFYFGGECSEIPEGIESECNLPHGKISEDKRLAVCHGAKTDINEKEDCPVILVKGKYKWEYDWKRKESHLIEASYIPVVLNPRLSDFQFGRCLNAEKCYLAISDFLGREKPVIDNRTDLQKITGKGFDKKYGFRTRPHQNAK